MGSWQRVVRRDLALLGEGLSLGYARYLGVGLASSAASLAGIWLTLPSTTAKFGLIVLWAITVSVVLRTIINLELARYTCLTEGQVRLGEGSVVKAGCHIRGPAIIGKSCEIGPDTYIGPYTSIGDNVRVVGGEIENSIIIGNAYIDCGRRIVDSIIGEGARIVASSRLPKGIRLIIGENTQLAL